MRPLFFIIFISILFAACGGNGTTFTGALPDNVDSLRTLLKEKQAELKTLNDYIVTIQEKISELDTSVKSRRLVTVDTVKRADFKHYVDIQATVQSDDVVSISSEVPGRIIRLLIKEGQQVSKGQLVAKIEMESIQKQMEELQTSLELANTVFERQSRLWEQKIGSEIQYLEAKNNKERIDRSLSTLKTQAAKSNVYAPTSGVIETLNTQEGEYASPGMPIAVVVNTSRLKIVSEIPENYIGMIKNGEKVRIKFPTLGTEIESRVTMIGKTINTSNRTFKVEAMLSGGKNELLKPNLLALMMISDFEAKNAITVPIEVVQQEANGNNFVYLLDQGKDGAYAKKTYVEVGKSYDTSILITKGLEGGEIIVAEGARGLANNELIEVAPSKSEADSSLQAKKGL